MSKRKGAAAAAAQSEEEVDNSEKPQIQSVEFYCDEDASSGLLQLVPSVDEPFENANDAGQYLAEVKYSSDEICWLGTRAAAFKKWYAMNSRDKVQIAALRAQFCLSYFALQDAAPSGRIKVIGPTHRRAGSDLFLIVGRVEAYRLKTLDECRKAYPSLLPWKEQLAINKAYDAWEKKGKPPPIPKGLLYWNGAWYPSSADAIWEFHHFLLHQARQPFVNVLHFIMGTSPQEALSDKPRASKNEWLAKASELRQNVEDAIAAKELAEKVAIEKTKEACEAQQQKEASLAAKEEAMIALEASVERARLAQQELEELKLQNSSQLSNSQISISIPSDVSPLPPVKASTTGAAAALQDDSFSPSRFLSRSALQSPVRLGPAEHSLLSEEKPPTLVDALVEVEEKQEKKEALVQALVRVQLTKMGLGLPALPSSVTDPVIRSGRAIVLPSATTESSLGKSDTSSVDIEEEENEEITQESAARGTQLLSIKDKEDSQGNGAQEGLILPAPRAAKKIKAGRKQRLVESSSSEEEAEEEKPKKRAKKVSFQSDEDEEREEQEEHSDMTWKAAVIQQIDSLRSAVSSTSTLLACKEQFQSYMTVLLALGPCPHCDRHDAQVLHPTINCARFAFDVPSSLNPGEQPLSILGKMFPEWKASRAVAQKK